MNFLDTIWANDLYRKLILSLLALLVQAIVKRIIMNVLLKRLSDDSPYLYTVRKITSYLITGLTAIILIGIWFQRFSDLSVAFGILAAGLAFALQEVIGSIAGWTTIITGKPFSIGDRIETGGIRGDVVDIGILRTTLMEIGNWLNGDHNTGRIVTLSNAFIFKEPLYNYSAHLNFVWDEVKIPVTYESDWKNAMSIMIKAVQNHPVYQELLPKAEKQRRDVRRKLAIRVTPLEPREYMKLTDNWIELGVVYPVDTNLRRSFRSQISQEILTRFVSEGITVASQTMAIVQFPANKNTPD